MHPEDERHNCSCLVSCSWDAATTAAEFSPQSESAVPAEDTEEARIVQNLLANLRQIVPRGSDNKSDGNNDENDCDCIKLLHDATNYIQILQSLIGESGRSCEVRHLLPSTFVAKLNDLVHQQSSLDEAVGRH